MKNETFDLIITDIQMPRMSGLELSKTIKETQSLKDTPILIMTTLDDDKTFQYALELEADDFTVKPIRHQELNLRLRNIIHRKTAE